jgi:transcriptional regulator with XRE-family HTH domain
VEDLRAAFGKRVRELRKERGLSQEALAERASLHWTYVSGVERGLRSPGLDVIGRLAAALRVSPAELFQPINGRYRSTRHTTKTT